MALPKNGEEGFREMVERERDLLWCLAIIEILDVEKIAAVTRGMLNHEIAKELGEYIPGSLENP